MDRRTFLQVLGSAGLALTSGLDFAADTVVATNVIALQGEGSRLHVVSSALRGRPYYGVGDAQLSEGRLVLRPRNVMMVPHGHLPWAVDALGSRVLIVAQGGTGTMLLWTRDGTSWHSVSPSDLGASAWVRMLPSGARALLSSVSVPTRSWAFDLENGVLSSFPLPGAIMTRLEATGATVTGFGSLRAGNGSLAYTIQPDGQIEAQLFQAALFAPVSMARNGQIVVGDVGFARMMYSIDGMAGSIELTNLPGTPGPFPGPMETGGLVIGSDRQAAFWSVRYGLFAQQVISRIVRVPLSAPASWQVLPAPPEWVTPRGTEASAGVLALAEIVVSGVAFLIAGTGSTVPLVGAPAGYVPVPPDGCGLWAIEMKPTYGPDDRWQRLEIEPAREFSQPAVFRNRSATGW